jgi:hypothetical protein
VISIIKFKLIEELVKKVSSEEKSGFRTGLIIFATVILLAVAMVYLTPTKKEPVVQAEMPSSEKGRKSTKKAMVIRPNKKTDAEIATDIAKEVLTTGGEFAENVRENRRQKDIAFYALKGERWTFTFGDWTDDEEKIISTHETLKNIPAVKLLKQKRQYLFIVENSKQTDPQHLIDSLQALFSMSVKYVDINQYLDRKKRDS